MNLFKLEITFKIGLFLIFINFVSLQVTKAKKISFLNDFKETTQDSQKFMREYNKYFDEITYEDNVAIKNINLNNQEIVQTSFKNKTNLMPNTEYKLFSISKEYAITRATLKEHDYFEAFYSKPMDEENAFALFLLSEIVEGKKSKFYYYLRNLPLKKTPVLYEMSSLELFGEDEGFSEVIREVNKYKKMYIELRRLIFSHGSDIKNEFIGSFLFGDYLWALNKVKYHSLKFNNTYVLIPGTEYLNLYGLENISIPYIKCCLNYTVKESEDTFDVYTSFTHEDFYEFHDKYENVTSILFNPSYTNKDLFFHHGINYVGENKFDYYNLNLTELNSKHLLLVNNATYLNVNHLRMSCNAYDISNLVYFLSNLSPLEVKENFRNVMRFLKEKVFGIDLLFEQSYHRESLDEIVESFKYLSNKQSFLTKLNACLENRYKLFGDDDKREEEEVEETIEYKEEF